MANVAMFTHAVYICSEQELTYVHNWAKTLQIGSNEDLVCSRAVESYFARYRKL